MLIGARTAAWSGGGGISAKSYVQDGLVAMWDGIENVGWGIHNSSARYWTDLISGTEINFDQYYQSFTWEDNSLVNSSYVNVSAYNSFGYIRTFEVLSFVSSATDQAPIIYFSNGQPKLMANVKDGYFSLAWGQNMRYGHQLAYFPNDNKMTLATMIVNDNNVDKFFYNTNLYRNIQTYNNNITSLNLFSENSTRWCCGKISSIRLYNRMLTTDEMAANYSIDKARFNLP